VNDISMKRLLTELRDGSIRETMSKEATVLYNTIQYNTTQLIEKKAMVLEQTQNIKGYELPLHKLHDLAPDIPWSLTH